MFKSKHKGLAPKRCEYAWGVLYAGNGCVGRYGSKGKVYKI